MSDATGDFTKSLLHDLGVKWDQVTSNTDAGTNCTFKWTDGEEKCTVQAIEALENHVGQINVQGDTRKVEFVDVRKRNLVTLRAGCNECPGQTDVVIRFDELQHSDLAEFAFVIGMVELKTDKAKLKSCQQLLELVAMSHMSQHGQGVVLLGTDLNAKWEVLFFDNPDHITVQAFKFGSVALKFFQEKLQSVHARVDELKLLSAESGMGRLHLSPEREQDLEGFDPTDEGTQVRLQKLKALERHFNENYNANVAIPFWAQSSDASGIYS